MIHSFFQTADGDRRCVFVHFDVPVSESRQSAYRTRSTPRLRRRVKRESPESVADEAVGPERTGRRGGECGSRNDRRIETAESKRLRTLRRDVDVAALAGHNGVDAGLLCVGLVS